MKLGLFGPSHENGSHGLRRCIWASGSSMQRRILLHRFRNAPLEISDAQLARIGFFVRKDPRTLDTGPLLHASRDARGHDAGKRTWGAGKDENEKVDV